MRPIACLFVLTSFLLTVHPIDSYSAEQTIDKAVDTATNSGKTTHLPDAKPNILQTPNARANGGTVINPPTTPNTPTLPGTSSLADYDLKRMRDIAKEVSKEKGWTEDVKNIAEAAALIVGGIWTYMLFVGKRQRYPRATLSHKIEHIDLGEGKLLLKVDTTISNTGDVLLKLRHGRLQIQKILPLPPEIKDTIMKGLDPVPKGEREIVWPILYNREEDWEEGKSEIEPGDHDVYYYDLILDSEVKVVEVYSYYRNVVKKKQNIGWGLTTVYDLQHEPKQDQSRRRDSLQKGEKNGALTTSR